MQVVINPSRRNSWWESTADRGIHHVFNVVHARRHFPKHASRKTGCSIVKVTFSSTANKLTTHSRMTCDSSFYLCRFFGTKCAGCGLGISPHDLVRKSRTDRVYHVPCFVCSVCRKEVATGEELFILENDKVLCKEDFFSHGRQRINRSTKKPLKDSSVDQINAPSEQSPLVVLSQPFEKQGEL